MPVPNPFVNLVAARTGLSPRVVSAWVQAEGGPQGNPLNIGPGRNYGNTQAAAQATANLINTSDYYKGIRASIATGNPAGQIAAIKSSPWDAGHYGNGVLDRTFGSPVPMGATPAAGGVGVAPPQPAAPPRNPNLGAILDINNRMQGLNLPPMASLMPQGLPSPTGAPAVLSPGAAPLASGSFAKVMKPFLGVPYQWGGNDAKTGLDCSSFVQQAMAKFGVKVPRTTYDQVNAGRAVGINQLAPGDAVFTRPGRAGPEHVGLYVGNGMVQESPHTGDVNKLIPLKDYLSGGFVAARRYLNA